MLYDILSQEASDLPEVYTIPHLKALKLSIEHASWKGCGTQGEIVKIFPVHMRKQKFSEYKRNFYNIPQFSIIMDEIYH